jgi:hypothetical protein
LPKLAKNIKTQTNRHKKVDNQGYRFWRITI